MTTRHRLCALTDLDTCTAQRFDVDDHPIAVVRVDDAVYAIGDTCSHQRISLSEGEVLGDDLQLECWKHGSAFSLLTGEPSMLPATRPVPVFPVTIEGDDVYVEVP